MGKIHKIITALVILALLGGVAYWFGTKHMAHKIATEAYHQIEANKFDREANIEALKKLEVAKALNENEPNIYTSLALFNSNNGYVSGGAYAKKNYLEGVIEKSTQLAQHAVDLAPNNSFAHAVLAKYYIINGDMQQVPALLNKAYELDPEGFYPYYYRAVAYRMMKHYEGALGYLGGAEENAKFDYQRRFVVSERLSNAKKLKNVELQDELYRKLIEMDPTSPHAHGNYANFLKRQKRYDEAMVQYQKVMELGPYPLAVEKFQALKEEMAGKKVN